MADRPDTLVFVPAWNEEQNLPGVLDELAGGLPEADVLVVDDGSTDGTARVAAEHGATVESFGKNRGLAFGIAAGYAYAAEHGYAFCGRVDADGQHPVAELERLLTRVRSGECDVAVGSRFVHGDGYEPHRYKPSPARVVGTSLLRRAMRVALGRPFHDATSGMYAVNAKAMPILGKPYEAGRARGREPPAPQGRRAARGGDPGRHAGARERRVEARRQEGRAPRAHGHRHARRVPPRAQALAGRKTAFARLRRSCYAPLYVFDW